LWISISFSLFLLITKSIAYRLPKLTPYKVTAFAVVFSTTKSENFERETCKSDAPLGQDLKGFEALYFNKYLPRGTLQGCPTEHLNNGEQRRIGTRGTRAPAWGRNGRETWFYRLRGGF